MEARMLPFFEAVAELASSYVLLPGSALHERQAAFTKLVTHAERLWDDAVSLFTRGSNHTALFLAIVTLEGTRKGGNRKGPGGTGNTRRASHRYGGGEESLAAQVAFGRSTFWPWRPVPW